MSAPTIGLIADLNTTQGQAALAKAMQDFPNKDFISGAQSAIEFKYKFLVAAGRLGSINDGVIMVLAQDEPNAILGLIAANRRLTEVGASSTHWIVAGDTGFRQRVAQAALSCDKGTIR
jgi:hypothetical protein